MAPGSLAEDSSPSSSPLPVLQFARWQSSVIEDFWQRFVELKLDTLRLDDRPLEIQGYFAPCSHTEVSKPLQLKGESLTAEKNGDRNQCPAPGTFYNKGTLQAFKEVDKKCLLDSEAVKLWEDISSGRAEDDCRLLNRFFVLSFADLKTWNFKYWFAFPAIKFPQPATAHPLQRASNYFTTQLEQEGVVAACSHWRDSPTTTNLPFFLLHILPNDIRARPLSDWGRCQEEGGKLMLSFYDPCHLPTNPGWPLRNLLVLAVVRWGLRNAKALCWREVAGKPDLNRSFVVDVDLPELPGWRQPDFVPEAVGWESNFQGKMAPLDVNLASSMDPKRLATQAADLNLKLMKWRLMPSLQLEMLSATKCLILGAGTLGCQVARGLMAWGVREITFVDCGRVGMSNPVRQSLYFYEDAINGGKLKAEAAAENLRRIFPGVNSRGENLEIPMPGHVIGQAQSTVDTCTRLKSLVDEHDVIFLLTDTRESRWLPTVLCSDANKIAITIAVGFDTFVVMRHGACPFPTSDARLGCYFCPDVIAPVDSTVNLTLDQQCTVSRPCLAPMSSAIGVEIAVNILHHPLGVRAGADKEVEVTEGTEHPLGIIPHQLRIFLSHFSQKHLCGSASESCTACSAKVISEYRKRGMEFVMEALNSSKYLEDLSGLTELKDSTKHVSIDWDDDE